MSCNYCRRVVSLDLAAMVARGLGYRPLVELPLRCRACGSRSFGLICQVGHTGPEWARPACMSGEPWCAGPSQRGAPQGSEARGAVGGSRDNVVV